MRDHIRFRSPQDFVVTEEDGAGVLEKEGARWFAEMLTRVSGLSVDTDLCQEDWGVVVFAARDGRRFWIGLNWWPEGDSEWLAHVHHRSLFQRLSRGGREALNQLTRDLHDVLCADPGVFDVLLCTERDL